MKFKKTKIGFTSAAISTILFSLVIGYFKIITNISHLIGAISFAAIIIVIFCIIVFFIYKKIKKKGGVEK